MSKTIPDSNIVAVLLLILVFDCSNIFVTISQALDASSIISVASFIVSGDVS